MADESKTLHYASFFEFSSYTELLLSTALTLLDSKGAEFFIDSIENGSPVEGREQVKGE